MTNQITEFLKTFASGRYAGARLQSTPEATILVLDEHVKASSRQLSLLKNKLSDILGVPLEITRHSDHLKETFLNALSAILTDTTDMSIEGAHFELLTKQKARLFLAVDSEHSILTSAFRDRIKETALSIGKPLGIDTVELEVSGRGRSGINDSQVVREVLKSAPVGAAELAARMNSGEGGECISSEGEIAVILDRLRRKGLLVWQPTGTYVPAKRALYLYSSHKNRRSSDVIRALELGRRRW